MWMLRRLRWRRGPKIRRGTSGFCGEKGRPVLRGTARGEVGEEGMENGAAGGAGGVDVFPTG